MFFAGRLGSMHSHTPCDGALKDVAEANIVTPKNLMFHNRPMPGGCYTILMDRVLAGCDEVEPPYQLEGADEHLLLAE